VKEKKNAITAIRRVITTVKTVNIQFANMTTITLDGRVKNVVILYIVVNTKGDF